MVVNMVFVSAFESLSAQQTTVTTHLLEMISTVGTLDHTLFIQSDYVLTSQVI